MLIMIELLFIVLLAMVLVMLYRYERSALRKLMPSATVEEYWSGKERRQHIRFRKSLEISYAIDKRPSLTSGGKTVDISEGGMKLLLDEKLSKGTVLNIKIDLPGKGHAAEARGVVVWSEDLPRLDISQKRFFHAGIKFISIKEQSAGRLTEFIRTNGRELET